MTSIVKQSTTTQPSRKPEQSEKLEKDNVELTSNEKGTKESNKKKVDRPRIEFSTLPDTIEELEALIKEIKHTQGRKPEFKEREQQFALIDKKINKEQEQISKLKEKVYEKNLSIVGVIEDQLKQVRAEIDDLKVKFDAMKAVEVGKRDKAKHASEYVKTLIDAKKTFQQQNFVKGFEKEEKIIDEIEKLNFQISTQSHNLKTEKTLIATLSKLEASLSHIPRLREFDHSINMAIQQRDSLKDKSKSNKEFDEVKQKLHEKFEKSNELRQQIGDKKAQNQAELETLREKRAYVKTLFNERKAIAAKFSSLTNEFYDNERKITACELKIAQIKRKQENEEKRRLYLERQAKREAYAAKKAEEERLAREEEELRIKQEQEALLETQRREEEERLRNPHSKEIENIKTLISYLKSLNFGGGKRQKNKTTHPVDKTILFSELGVSIPKSSSEVSSIISTLENKLVEYEKEIIDDSVPIEEVRKMRGVEAPTEAPSVESDSAPETSE